MMSKKMMLSAFAVVVCACSGMAALGQSATDGAIGGTVEDKSGGVISNATVVVRSNATNAEQTLKSDGSGFFRAIHLQPGAYTVTVTAGGFNVFRAATVTVQVGSLVDPHAVLGVGETSTIVDVTSVASAINTTSPDFANTIDQKILQDLPVANYRWSSYALLTPGVVADGSGFGLLSFRGQSTLLNNVTFDGTDDNQAYFSEERGRTRVGYSTAKASIQEFQVNTSNYSVEYGRSAGGVVNAVTKSGSNELHGEAYFYDRDAGWGAKNPFNKVLVQTGFSPSPVTFASQVVKPKDWRKQMGVGVGGPILKDKLFFFFAFDDYKRNFPGLSLPNNPSFFLSFPDASLPTGTCATTATTTVNGATCQLAANLNKLAPVVAGGKVVTQNYALVTPAQYAAAAAVYTKGIQGLITETGTVPRTGDQNIFFPKLDWQINGKNHATVEGNRLRWTSPAGIQTGTSAITNGIASFGNDYVKSTFLIAKLDTAVTTRLSNEIRYQYGRDFEYETNQTATPYEQATLLNTTTPTPYKNPYGIAPNVSITNGPTLGTPTFLNRKSYPDERRWQIADTANLVRGNHNLKFGVDYIHTYDLLQNLSSQFGSYSYTTGANNQSLAAYITDANVTNGCAIANTTTNTVTHQECYNSFSQAFGSQGFDFAQSDYAVFAQDEWKFNPRLSLTLGVRYEYEQTPSPQIPNPVLDSYVGFNGAQINGSTSRFPSNKANIGPRVGFAYDIFGTGKTVLRGGYGEFFARLINSTIYNAISQSGVSAGQQNVSYANSALSGVLFPQIIDPASFSASGSGASSATYFDKNFKLPEIHQADLTVEQDLGWNTTFSVTWLAAFGRRLSDFVDTNIPASNGTISYTVADPTGIGPLVNGQSLSLPFYGQLTKAQSANGRPIPTYAALTDVFSGVNSNYEGLVGHVSHRFSHNLEFDANYTWSHALDYGENSTVGSNTNVLLDPYNLRRDYGNSNFNVPNRLVMNAVYQIPSSFHGILGLLLNEYEISPSFAGQSGLPYSANVSGSTTNLFAAGTTAAAVQNSINGSGGANRIPTLQRNTFRQPRTLVADLRLSKRFNVADRAKIELLAESFNIANHQNVTAVGTNAYTYAAGASAGSGILTINPLFGVPSNANSTNNYSVRQIQLGARVQF
jgi:hypothetical protein